MSRLRTITVRLPVRFDMQEQIDLIKEAAAKLHWSFNRMVVESSVQVAKSILAATQADKEALSHKVAFKVSDESKQPTA